MHSSIYRDIFFSPILYSRSFSEGSCSFHLITPAFCHCHSKIIPALWLCDRVTSPITSNTNGWYVSARTSRYHILHNTCIQGVFWSWTCSLKNHTLTQRGLSPSVRTHLTPKLNSQSDGSLCPLLWSSKLGSTPGKIRWSSSAGWQPAHSKLAVVSQFWPFFSKMSKGISPHLLICKFDFWLSMCFTDLQLQHQRKRNKSRRLECCCNALLWEAALHTKKTL